MCTRELPLHIFALNAIVSKQEFISIIRLVARSESRVHSAIYAETISWVFHEIEWRSEVARREMVIIFHFYIACSLLSNSQYLLVNIWKVWILTWSDDRLAWLLVICVDDLRTAWERIPFLQFLLARWKLYQSFIPLEAFRVSIINFSAFDHWVAWNIKEAD